VGIVHDAVEVYCFTLFDLPATQTDPNDPDRPVYLDELNSSESMNSGTPLENPPPVPQGHHHQDHLAFTCFISIHVGVRYSRRRANNKCSISTGCGCETVDLTKKM
jgi:hypothetical protein